MEFKELENNLGYTFSDKKLLNNALTHKSYTKHQLSNERLEFLGDAILQLVVSTYLYNCYSDLNEGTMAKLRASLVRKQTLYELALKIGIDKYILMSKNEIANGGRQKPSLLSDAFEAVLAAIYLDSDYDTSAEVILDIYGTLFDEHLNGGGYTDYKTQLQEKLQKGNGLKMSYEVIDQKGKPHDMTFDIVVEYNSKIIGKGSGKSKKEAGQNAAKYALENIYKVGK